MGTLEDQPHRNYRLFENYEINGLINQLKDASEKHKITLDQTIKIFELAESTRKNTIIVDNGNIWDEQIIGIGKILENLSIKVENTQKANHLNEN